MAEKNFNARFVQKHDVEENWIKATGFTPKSGELIIYDADAAHPFPRMKVGDGESNVNDLPFCIDEAMRAYVDETILGGEW